MEKDFIVDGKHLTKYELIDLTLNTSTSLNSQFVGLIRSAISELRKRGYEIEIIEKDNFPF